MARSITVMVPAYNEGKNLTNVICSLEGVLQKQFSDYEIIIFNDYSTDRTGEIAEELAKKNPKIRIVHNRKNMGLGYNYRRGVELATKEYYGWVPGDNEMEMGSVENIFRRVGEADIIVPYTENTENRKWKRRVISRSFTRILNLLFGLKLKYYNGIVVHKTDILRGVKMWTNSFAFQIEILIPLIKNGYTYIEVPQRVKPVSKTKVFRLKNISGVIKSVTRMFYEVKIKGLLTV